MTKRRILGREVLQWLADAGVIPGGTTRVVIDAAWNDAVQIYVTMYGDESLISIKPPAELGVEVTVVGPTNKDGVLNALRAAGMSATPKPYKTSLCVDGEWLETAESTEGLA